MTCYPHLPPGAVRLGLPEHVRPLLWMPVRPAVAAGARITIAAQWVGRAEVLAPTFNQVAQALQGGAALPSN